MAIAERGGLFATKPAQKLVSEADEQGHQLRRVVGLLDLSALGLYFIYGRRNSRLRLNPEGPPSPQQPSRFDRHS
jgi:hypothetical protein